jgi:pilus assembly protein Flp/PilA
MLLQEKRVEYPHKIHAIDQVDTYRILIIYHRRLFNMMYAGSSRQEQGQGLVEYSLILVLVAIVVIAALMVLGPIIGNVFSTVNSSLSGVSGGVPDGAILLHPEIIGGGCHGGESLIGGNCYLLP